MDKEKVKKCLQRIKATSSPGLGMIDRLADEALAELDKPDTPPELEIQKGDVYMSNSKNPAIFRILKANPTNNKLLYYCLANTRENVGDTWYNTDNPLEFLGTKIGHIDLK